MREIDDGDGWKIREIIEPDAEIFKKYNQYFYKRKRAPRLELRSKMAKQLAGYVLIEKDLRNAGVWLKEIEKLNPRESVKKSVELASDREIFNLIKGLYVASLTFYGKCFTACEGRRIKLEKSIIDHQYLEIHDEVMHMRHNYAAHSGADSFEEVKIALVLHPNKNTDSLPRLYRELSQVDFKDNRGEENFLALIEHVREKVIDKAQKVEMRIFENEVLEKGKDYWYRLAKKS